MLFVEVKGGSLVFDGREWVREVRGETRFLNKTRWACGPSARSKGAASPPTPRGGAIPATGGGSTGAGLGAGLGFGLLGYLKNSVRNSLRSSSL